VKVQDINEKEKGARSWCSKKLLDVGRIRNIFTRWKKNAEKRKAISSVKGC